MDERPEREPDDEPPAAGAAGQRLAAVGPMLRVKNWARALRRDAHAVHLASRDPRVPWTVKLLAIAVAGYALSPIDASAAAQRPVSRTGAIAIVALWILSAAALGWIVFVYWRA